MARSVRRGPTLPRTSSDRAGPRGSNRSESRGSVDFAARDGRRTKSAVAADRTPVRPRRAAARRQALAVGDPAPARVRTARVPVTPTGPLSASAGQSEPCIGSPTCPARTPRARRAAPGRRWDVRGRYVVANRRHRPHLRASPVRVAPLLAPLSAERSHALSAADAARAPQVAARAAGQRTVDVSHAVSESRPTRSVPGDRAHSRPPDTTPGRERRSTRAVGTTARATAPRRRAAHVTRSTTSATHPERRPAAPRPSPPP